MFKMIKITFLLIGVLVLGSVATAQQQQAKPDEHEQHQSEEQPKEQAQHQHDQHHDHSGHSMSKPTGSATDHIGEHDKDHSVEDKAHDHDIDHSQHTAESTEHGDMHHHHHVDHDHMMDHEGTMIMGQNLDKLPSSCKSISEEVEITVRAGRKYAAKFPGTAFAFDQQEWRVKPCAKVTFHFINEDNIRHQFMMHGLPKYLYKYGMFHLEVTGPKTVSGTIIAPGSDDTFLVHCDISHHMEKGMKAQFVVGKGGENIPSIPGLTPYNLTDVYEAESLPQVSDKAKQSAMVREITKAFAKPDTQNYLIILIGAFVGLLFIPLIKALMPRKKTEE